MVLKRADVPYNSFVRLMGVAPPMDDVLSCVRVATPVDSSRTFIVGALSVLTTLIGLNPPSVLT